MNVPSSFQRLDASQVQARLLRLLVHHGLESADAASCAEQFTQNTLDGVYSHGIQRFPRFIDYLKRGLVNPKAHPSLVVSVGALERWDAHLGPGIVAAKRATSRAMELAARHGIGCVALRNSQHWMRGGSYGWQAARGGFGFLGWSNTTANMAPWGSRTLRLGNNPLVLALPNEPEALVLDMAMSQYSYGSLEHHSLEGKLLDVPGGLDADGQLSQDPASILQSGQVLPAGFWKGSGLSLVLDLLAAILSAGDAVHEIRNRPDETGLSQVFVCWDVQRLDHGIPSSPRIHALLEDYLEASPTDPAHPLRYPGQRALECREYNRHHGIPVHEKTLQALQDLEIEAGFIPPIPSPFKP